MNEFDEKDVLTEKDKKHIEHVNFIVNDLQTLAIKCRLNKVDAELLCSSLIHAGVVLTMTNAPSRRIAKESIEKWYKSAMEELNEREQSYLPPEQ